MPSASEVVMLRGGLAVPLAVLQVLWQLEDRGARFALDGDTILVRPRGLLRDEDRAFLAAHKREVAQVVAYVNEVCA